MSALVQQTNTANQNYPKQNGFTLVSYTGTELKFEVLVESFRMNTSNAISCYITRDYMFCFVFSNFDQNTSSSLIMRQS